MNPNDPSSGALPPTQPTTPPVVADGQNPYGFIMDAEHKRKKKLGKPSSFKSLILLIIGGGLVLSIAIVAVSSLASRSQQAQTNGLISLTAQQQEIIRVAGLGVSGSTDLLTQSWAETVKLSVTSQQKSLITYLTKNKVKDKELNLNSKLNKDTDAALKTATANNRFSDEFSSNLKQSLTTYASDLKKSYEGASGANSKAILKDSYESTTLLLK
jgi:flagellar basal body-associated protein FliL